MEERLRRISRVFSLTILLRQMGAVKAIGRDAARGSLKLRGPAKVLVQMGSQLTRSVEASTITEHARWPGEIETELAAVEARIENPGGRESFPNRVVVKIRHIDVARAVHRHAGRID